MTVLSRPESSDELGVAVITGAGGGIGGALALALAAEGLQVVLVGRRAETLREVADSIPAGSPPARTHAIDLTDDDEVQALTAEIERDLGRVDVLIHSAGVISVGAIESAELAELDRQYRTNVRAPLLLTKLMLPMLRSSRGQIVMLNSSVGLQARAGVGHYAASKYALRALTESLRAEVNADGVRVLAIYPGRTAGAMQQELHAEAGEAYRPETLVQPGDVAETVLAALRLPRTAEITDIQIRPMAPPS